MIPSKPLTMLEKHPEVAETIARIREGWPFHLPACIACGRRNLVHVDVSPRDPALPFGIYRSCECLFGETGTVAPVSEDAVVGMVRRLVVPTPPPNHPAAAPPAPAEELTRPNTSHLFFDTDIVGCSVCGGTEPFTFKVRHSFPTVLRALQVIADRHPMTPHALRASL